jgi:peptidoglycan/LPS O-acetylase OafA/YrhL
VVVNLAVLGTLVFVLSVFSYRYVEYPALIRKGKARAGPGREAAATRAGTRGGPSGLPPAAPIG